MDIALLGWFIVVGALSFLAGWYLRPAPRKDTP